MATTATTTTTTNGAAASAANVATSAATGGPSPRSFGQAGSFGAPQGSLLSPLQTFRHRAGGGSLLRRGASPNLSPRTLVVGFNPTGSLNQRLRPAPIPASSSTGGTPQQGADASSSKTKLEPTVPQLDSAALGQSSSEVFKPSARAGSSFLSQAFGALPPRQLSTRQFLATPEGDKQAKAESQSYMTSPGGGVGPFASSRFRSISPNSEIRLGFGASPWAKPRQPVQASPELGTRGSLQQYQSLLNSAEKQSGGGTKSSYTTLPNAATTSTASASSSMGMFRHVVSGAKSNIFSVAAGVGHTFGGDQTAKPEKVPSSKNTIVNANSTASTPASVAGEHQSSSCSVAADASSWSSATGAGTTNGTTGGTTSGRAPTGTAVSTSSAQQQPPSSSSSMSTTTTSSNTAGNHVNMSGAGLPPTTTNVMSGAGLPPCLPGGGGRRPSISIGPAGAIHTPIGQIILNRSPSALKSIVPTASYVERQIKTQGSDTGITNKTGEASTSIKPSATGPAQSTSCTRTATASTSKTSPSASTATSNGAEGVQRSSQSIPLRATAQPNGATVATGGGDHGHGGGTRGAPNSESKALNKSASSVRMASWSARNEYHPTNNNKQATTVASSRTTSREPPPHPANNSTSAAANYHAVGSRFLNYASSTAGASRGTSATGAGTTLQQQRSFLGQQNNTSYLSPPSSTRLGLGFTSGVSGLLPGASPLLSGRGGRPPLLGAVEARPPASARGYSQQVHREQLRKTSKPPVASANTSISSAKSTATTTTSSKGTTTTVAASSTSTMSKEAPSETAAATARARGPVPKAALRSSSQVPLHSTGQAQAKGNASANNAQTTATSSTAQPTTATACSNKFGTADPVGIMMNTRREFMSQGLGAIHRGPSPTAALVQACPPGQTMAPRGTSWQRGPSPGWAAGGVSLGASFLQLGASTRAQSPPLLSARAHKVTGFIRARGPAGASLLPPVPNEHDAGATVEDQKNTIPAQPLQKSSPLSQSRTSLLGKDASQSGGGTMLRRSQFVQSAAAIGLGTPSGEERKNPEVPSTSAGTVVSHQHQRQHAPPEKTSSTSATQEVIATANGGVGNQIRGGRGEVARSPQDEKPPVRRNSFMEQFPPPLPLPPQDAAQKASPGNIGTARATGGTAVDRTKVLEREDLAKRLQLRKAAAMHRRCFNYWLDNPSAPSVEQLFGGSTTSSALVPHRGGLRPQTTQHLYRQGSVGNIMLQRQSSTKNLLAGTSKFQQSPKKRNLEDCWARNIKGHWAAVRIQRCWALYIWQRNFGLFGRRVMDYVGSLDWLQRHDKLYGTEMAEACDEQRWDSEYQTCPADEQTDPWGNKHLKEHLHRMWYGA
ncbi:unnamed protein product [Amoebophrya sp. A25]|nr:unnamed protein product [Amoebophrya sp. A25]|eukprot:GSA25T00025906001.1